MRWRRPAPDYAERWGNKNPTFGATPVPDPAAVATVKQAWAPLLTPFVLLGSGDLFAEFEQQNDARRPVSVDPLTVEEQSHG